MGNNKKVVETVDGEIKLDKKGSEAIGFGNHQIALNLLAVFLLWIPSPRIQYASLPTELEKLMEMCNHV